jgi:hypothetical protein
VLPHLEQIILLVQILVLLLPPTTTTPYNCDDVIEGVRSYGHLFYPEASPGDLVNFSSDGENYKVHRSIVQDLSSLIQAARDEGHRLRIVTGFRTVSEQTSIFYNGYRMAETLAAPPGYTEHHTGYAVDFEDIGSDRRIQSTNLLFFKIQPQVNGC